MLDLLTDDTVKVELKEGAQPRSQAVDKALPQTKVKKLEPTNGVGKDCQMMTTDHGVRIITQLATLGSMPHYLVMRLDSDGEWRLATEPRPERSNRMSTVNSVKKGDPVQIANSQVPREERERTGRGLIARGPIRQLCVYQTHLSITVEGDPPVATVMNLDGTAEYEGDRHQLFLEAGNELISVDFTLQSGTPS